VEEGERFGTTSPTTAAILFRRRLVELRALREKYPAGLPQSKSEDDELNRVSTYVGYHLAEMENGEGREPPTKSHIVYSELRLTHLTQFLASCDPPVLYLRDINSAHVKAYAAHLRTFQPKGRRRFKRTTQRRYLDAFGFLLQRAVSEGRVEKNQVREMVDRPTHEPSPTRHYELWEAALWLELARRMYPPDQPGRPIYALLGFMLLTGCIESERKRIELTDLRFPGDPEFPRGIVNVHGRKTIYRDRIIPMHPQLAEILTEYLEGPNVPSGPLLFPEPGANGTTPIGDWSAALDNIARASGYPAEEIRTRGMRVTFATHRLCTLDELGQPMTAWKLRGEMGHGTEQMIEKRYGRYAQHRARRPVLEYRWSEWADRYGDRLTKALAGLLTDGQRRTLEALSSDADGLATNAWMAATGDQPGTFIPRRDALTQLGLVQRVGTGRGNPWRLTADGARVLGVEPQV
jgi:integrase